MDHTNSFFDFTDQLSQAAAAGGGGLAGGQPTPAAAATPDYLESGSKHCESSKHYLTESEEKEQKKKEDEEKYEVTGCGCRSRFCNRCCVGMGLSLRERLIPVLETFTGLTMWTFTIDPKLFSSPAEAFKYVRDNRCISNTMRELRKRGYLHTNRYFVVVEWQMGEGDAAGTLMPHWHLLADSSYIPFDTVCDLWNRFRPAWAGPVQGNRPGFGSVRFTAPKFDSPKHAACYACKYLIKYPEKGYPDWVLDSHDVHRFSTSRGFWPTESDAEAKPEPAPNELPSCTDADESDPDNLPVVEEVPRTTIRERLAKCGEKSVLMKVSECVNQVTGEVIRRKEFVWRLDARLSDIADCLHRTLNAGAKRLGELPRSALVSLFKFRMTRTR